MRLWHLTRDKATVYESLTKSLDRNSRWIEVADTKAGVFLVYIVAVLRFATEPAARVITSNLAQFRVNPNAVDMLSSAVLGILFASVVGFSIYSIVHCFRVLQPRTGNRTTVGHIFFGDAAARVLDDFAQQATSMKSDDLHHELAEQVHTTAGIARTKYGHVAKAWNGLYYLTFLSIALYITSLYLG